MLFHSICTGQEIKCVLYSLWLPDVINRIILFEITFHVNKTQHLCWLTITTVKFLYYDFLIILFSILWLVIFKNSECLHARWQHIDYSMLWVFTVCRWPFTTMCMYAVCMNMFHHTKTKICIFSKNGQSLTKMACDNTQKSSMLLVRKLYMLMQNLGPLPDDVCLNMKLLYYDEGKSTIHKDIIMSRNCFFAIGYFKIWY